VRKSTRGGGIKLGIAVRSRVSIARAKRPEKNPNENGDCRDQQNQNGHVERFCRFCIHARCRHLAEGTCRRILDRGRRQINGQATSSCVKRVGFDTGTEDQAVRGLEEADSAGFHVSFDRWEEFWNRSTIVPHPRAPARMIKGTLAERLYKLHYASTD